MQRQFSAGGPDRLWVADFTYLRCWEGVAYFAFVLDVFSRMIVGWQLAATMRTTLVLDALRMALGVRAPGADIALVHHSDMGSQYVSDDYTQVLDDHDVLASIGSVGDAYSTPPQQSLNRVTRTTHFHCCLLRPPRDVVKGSHAGSRPLRCLETQPANAHT